MAHRRRICISNRQVDSSVAALQAGNMVKERLQFAWGKIVRGVDCFARALFADNRSGPAARGQCARDGVDRVCVLGRRQRDAQFDVCVAFLTHAYNHQQPLPRTNITLLHIDQQVGWRRRQVPHQHVAVLHIGIVLLDWARHDDAKRQRHRPGNHGFAVIAGEVKHGVVGIEIEVENAILQCEAAENAPGNALLIELQPLQCGRACEVEEERAVRAPARHVLEQRDARNVGVHFSATDVESDRFAVFVQLGGAIAHVDGQGAGAVFGNFQHYGYLAVILNNFSRHICGNDAGKHGEREQEKSHEKRTHAATSFGGMGGRISSAAGAVAIEARWFAGTRVFGPHQTKRCTNYITKGVCWGLLLCSAIRCSQEGSHHSTAPHPSLHGWRGGRA